MAAQLELLKGTLDVLILKAVSWEPLHGYGVSRRIREATADAFQVEEGALYPALRRLEGRGFLESEWRTSETGREARFYTLTPQGEQELERGVRSWGRYVEAMNRVLHARPPALEG
jgi:PadR family transcriptional regulator, regulatory protein PadR